MTDDFNPYMAPEASIGSTEEAVRSSRWSVLRWIPACYCGLMAIAGLLGSIAMAGMTTWVLIRYGIRAFEAISSNPTLHIFRIYAACLLYVLGGFFGILSTRAWLGRRWGFAILFSLMLFSTIFPGKLLIDRNASESRIKRP